ncbi:MAG: hypothetical protein ACYTGZ_08215 [Planctomycetota bacterium]|jgi:hypothetical protein
MGEVGDDAVKTKTGRDWKQWFARLDKAGAKEFDHKGIVAWLDEHDPGLGGWWTQMVTVTYEQARGLRDKHEKPEGYEISRSKTVGVPIQTLYKAWSEKRRRNRWLADPGFTVRKATTDKSMRITWVDGATHVDAYFWDKGPGKSQIQVQHKKLGDAREAESKKAYWSAQLTSLKSYLDG